jgi:DnaJ-class molecular chaperone
MSLFRKRKPPVELTAEERAHDQKSSPLYHGKETCPVCDGHGKVLGIRCRDCGGLGRLYRMDFPDGRD